MNCSKLKYKPRKYKYKTRFIKCMTYHHTHCTLWKMKCSGTDTSLSSCRLIKNIHVMFSTGTSCSPLLRRNNQSNTPGIIRQGRVGLIRTQIQFFFFFFLMCGRLTVDVNLHTQIFRKRTFQIKWYCFPLSYPLPTVDLK